MEINDDQQRQIRAFIENKPMAAAVLAVLMPDDEELGAGVPLADDAEYGRAVKVWRGARDLMRERVSELERIAFRNPQPVPSNPAR
ncbi:MAG: hypothetical protein KF889_01615 [Alphaproteobacteria bacterium]|nr:hypothetical protein [Alphaproteobacteria bacterium]MCW5741604.1 hypothetical protein [Alphaproteobacteria bacterium]